MSKLQVIVGSTRETRAADRVLPCAAPLRNTLLIPFVTEAFGEDGQPADPATATALTSTLDDLTWWSNALSRARSEGELLPGTFRARAAAAAARAD
jgi:hypothetical protein